MIPLIGVLLCVYLVFKGFEILQIAICAPASTGRSTGIVLGVIAVIASILIGSVFALILLSSGAPRQSFP